MVGRTMYALAKGTAEFLRAPYRMTAESLKEAVAEGMLRDGARVPLTGVLHVLTPFVEAAVAVCALPYPVAIWGRSVYDAYESYGIQ